MYLTCEPRCCVCGKLVLKSDIAGQDEKELLYDSESRMILKKSYYMILKIASVMPYPPHYVLDFLILP